MGRRSVVKPPKQGVDQAWAWRPAKELGTSSIGNRRAARDVYPAVSRSGDSGSRRRILETKGIRELAEIFRSEVNGGRRT
jgi:hypothetical protein